MAGPAIRPVLPANPDPFGGMAADRFGAFVAKAPVIGTKEGPLQGLSVGIKDLLAFRDHTPLCGLSEAPFATLGTSSPVVERLVEAGAEIAGFTALTALAYEPSGVNVDGSRPINPWNKDHVCGGSSSGSAVAVAAGLVPLALGSDTAGSLRIPAQCSGVASWKPTFGLLSLDGVMPLAPSLDCLGFMARESQHLDDVACLFAEAAPDFTSVVVASDLLPECAEDVTRTFGQTLEWVNQLDLPIRATSLKPLLEAADAPVFALLQGEAYRSFETLIKADVLPKDLAKRLGKGASISDQALDEATEIVRQLSEQWTGSLFGSGSCLMLPAMPVTTPTVAQCTQGHPDFAPRHLYALSAFTRFVNGLGLPALALPMGFDARSLPIAVQLVGPKGSDRALLALAKRLEAKRGAWTYPSDSLTSTSSEVRS